ncbi:MAG: PEP-CTERM sorting domain-containing protein [Planctomycetes bacterium]|nr:PEP-CTERM sorting domain-containing protein [Planctomycetota bacterium]
MKAQAMTVVSGVVLSLILSSVAGAQDVAPSVTFWQVPPGTEASWFVPNHWSAGVPTLWTTAYINNGGAALVGPSTSSTGAVAANLHLGGHRGGSIHQTDGLLAVRGATWMGPIGYGLPLPEVYPGPTGQAGGTYRLDGGTFTTANLFIGAGWTYYAITNAYTDGPAYGINGSVFTQNRGDVVVDQTMYVGYAPITICAEPMTADAEAAMRTAADADYLYRPGALYVLNDGTFTAATARIGYGGKGRFVQRGGSAAFEGALFIGGGQNYIYPLPMPMGMQTDRPAESDLKLWPGYYDGGQYQLIDGDVAAGSIHVGQQGRGTMVQSGGTVKVAASLQVGSDWWWYPILATDGTTDAMSSAVMPQVVLPAVGTYRLEGDAVLATATTEVGLGGTGHFIQDGGSHRVAGALRIGDNRYWFYDDPRIMTADGSFAPIPVPYPVPSDGRYTLNRGLVQAARLELGAGYNGYPTDALTVDPRMADQAAWAVLPWKPATFTQNGGAAAIAGPIAVYGGTYRLNDGAVKAYSLQLADGYPYSPSAFIQTGGEADFGDGGIRIGPAPRALPLDATTAAIEETPSFAPVYGPSTLALHGGRLSTPSIRVLGAGSAVSQTGGVMNVHAMTVAGGEAKASFTGGWLNVDRLQVGSNALAADVPSSRLHVGRSANITVSEQATLGGGAAYSAEPGANLLMSGADFHNASTRSDALAGLFHTRMTFVTGPTDDNIFETYEAAGKDLGFTRAGFWRNFVMDSLVVGTPDWSHVWDIGTLQLVDDFDNQANASTDRPEALYVHELVVGPGSILDLNGLNLYALVMRIHPDAKIIGDLPSVRLDAVEMTRPGDADMDGDVDLDDFVCLKNNFGLTARVHWGHGDYDGNGRVDLDDFALLKNNFGTAAAVPEPATLVLLALGAATLRRRR